MDSFRVTTQRRNELIDITAEVKASLRRRGLNEGIGVVYCPHTTAAVTVNEGYDPDVVHDMLLWLERAVPHVQPGFRHGEGNSDSHVKASLVGSSATVLVADGQLGLGEWQGGFFCGFGGARPRPGPGQGVGGWP